MFNKPFLEKVRIVVIVIEKVINIEIKYLVPLLRLFIARAIDIGKIIFKKDEA